MSIFIRDLKGGLAITRIVMVAVMVFALFGTGADLAFESLRASLLAERTSDTGPSLPLLVWVLLSWMPPIFVGFLLTLLMIEIAAIGADRGAGKEASMHLVFRPRVAGALFAVCLFGLLIATLLTWLLSTLKGHLFVTLILEGFIRTDNAQELESARLVGQIIEMVMQLLYLIAFAFGVSRLALIAVILRHHDVGLGEVWKRQMQGFDSASGSFRNRFFRIFLVLLLVDAAFGEVVMQVIGGTTAADLVHYPITNLLIIVLPVAVLTHMVRSQPVPASDAEDPGEGRLE
ncbi:MAG: hypothetical protein P1U37_03205 [Minwuia sp.]|nr:hypothetical protein [Minwuia sp.]